MPTAYPCPRFNLPLIMAASLLSLALSSTLGIISVPEGASYHFYCHSAIIATYHGHYKRARLLADKAMKADRKEKIDAYDGLHLADTLIAIGQYQEAKQVTERLPAIENSPRERDYPLVSIDHRRYLLGQALSGLHDFRGAVTVLSPGLPHAGWHTDIQFELIKAHLALNEPEVAAAFLAQAHYAGNSKWFNLYSAMTKLSTGNDAAAHKITNDLVHFFLENEKYQDPEGISNMEFAAEFMKRKGHPIESAELLSQADRLKRQ